MKLKIEENLILKGVHTITRASLKTARDFELAEKIDILAKQGKEYLHFVEKLNRQCKTKIFVIDNIITTAGKVLIANNIAESSPDNDIQINFSALGTGSSTPAVSDTTLNTEAFRKGIASRSNNGNEVSATAFYTAGDASGLFKEHAIFCDATDTTDSGVLFSRVLLNSGAGINKSLTETLTIDYTITIGV